MHELQVHQIELEMQNDELRRVQLALEESRDRYVELYEFAPIGYLGLNSNGVIEEINLTGAALLGIERGKLISRGFAPFVASEDKDAWHQYFMRAKQSGEKQSCELVLQRNDGSIMHARLDGQRIEGRTPAVRIALSDISEHKRLEMEIQEQRKEMAELHTLHVAAQTAAAIARELNQPLLSIASYSEAALMLMKSGKPDYGKIHKALDGCERQALRAGQSIRDLFEFLNAQEFKSEPFDLNREIFDVLQVAKLEHELKFDFVFHEDEGHAVVKASRAHVQKVLFNLLHNCVEAMQVADVPRPAISVAVRAQKDESVARVTIQDNGPGIKAEDSLRLFEPFFTTRDKGIGMGLAISRSLIEENGGKLWVDPQAGSGAAFHFTLPLAS
ncbi:MAG: ATP-binding protein [Sideroxydans sp.]|nr:ATP-binding protein [Sideroxydans sp.]